MTKRVLVTGGSGFVGANLAHRLVREGHHVHLLLRELHNAWRLETIRADVTLHRADLENRAAVAQVVAQVRPDWVFHLAAHGAYSWETDVMRILGTNVVGTANLLDACLRTGCEVLVNTGSSSEYGLKEHPPNEDERLEPNSHYATAKASATLLCQCIARSHDIPMPTLRLYSVYGPYEEPNRLIPSLIVCGLRGALPPLTAPDTARDFVYVDDVLDAYQLAATHAVHDQGTIYNVGSGAQTSLRALVELARRVLGISTEPVWGSMADRSWDTSVWVADASKIAAELGWQPRHSLELGFRRTIDWLRADQTRLQMYTDRLAAVRATTA